MAGPQPARKIHWVWIFANRQLGSAPSLQAWPRAPPRRLQASSPSASTRRRCWRVPHRRFVMQTEQVVERGKCAHRNLSTRDRIERPLKFNAQFIKGIQDIGASLDDERKL